MRQLAARLPNAKTLEAIAHPDIRPTMANKIILGFTPLLLVILVVTLFTLVRLNQVHRINNAIVTVDLVVNAGAKNMIDILLDQESYSQRYVILKSEEYLSLFWKRDAEFVGIHRQIARFSADGQFSALAPLEERHALYNQYFQSGIKFLDSASSRPYQQADSLRKTAFDAQMSALNDLIDASDRSHAAKTAKTAAILRSTIRIVILVSVLGIALATFVAVLIVRHTLRGIRTLKEAAALVSKGKFKDLPSVRSHDELGDLSQAFNEMANRLIELEEMYVDSSPLTRLPGGIAIENTLKRRIDAKIPFAFCLMDLDNFKPFNDRYGYARGNGVIKCTAEIILSAARALGTETDFVGHIGGDDFALLSVPEKFEEVCRKVIDEFDRRIPEFYDAEDREKRCIFSVNRQGEKLTFPIMTISIAALNSEKSPVENIIEVGEIIAELKKYAKTFAKSNVVIDRRGGKLKRRKE